MTQDNFLKPPDDDLIDKYQCLTTAHSDFVVETLHELGNAAFKKSSPFSFLGKAIGRNADVRHPEIIETMEGLKEEIKRHYPEEYHPEIRNIIRMDLHAAWQRNYPDEPIPEESLEKCLSQMKSRGR